MIIKGGKTEGISSSLGAPMAANVCLLPSCVQIKPVWPIVPLQFGGLCRGGVKVGHMGLFSSIISSDTFYRCF